MINLKLTRMYLKPEYCIGKLYVDGSYFCDTLEDFVRPEGSPKVYGKTAIPYGEYKVVMSFSNRFQRIMPEILDVPGFTGIRIHSGNTDADTSGCVLLGKNTERGKLTESRFYSNMLNNLLTNAKQDISISIVNPSTEA